MDGLGFGRTVSRQCLPTTPICPTSSKILYRPAPGASPSAWRGGTFRHRHSTLSHGPYHPFTAWRTAHLSTLYFCAVVCYVLPIAALSWIVRHRHRIACSAKGPRIGGLHV